MSRRCSNNSVKTGLTLIEVVASVALLSTLLVGTLLAYGRHAHQIRRSRLRLQALRAADAMLTDWMDDPAALPARSRGDVPGEEGLIWETRPVDSPHEGRLRIGIVRLSILAKDAGEDEEARPLATVDVAVGSVTPSTQIDTSEARP